MVYSWVHSCGMVNPLSTQLNAICHLLALLGARLILHVSRIRVNTVCTLYEITEGENTADEEFHGLDTEVLIKVLRTLEASKKAELFDDNQGVKFFLTSLHMSMLVFICFTSSVYRDRWRSCSLAACCVEGTIATRICTWIRICVFCIHLSPIILLLRTLKKKSHRGHGCLSVVSVVCCQVEVSATDWSIVVKSPTDCGASLCVI